MKNVAFMKNSPLKYSIGNLLVSKELNDKLMLYKEEIRYSFNIRINKDVTLNSHPVLNNNEE